MTEWAGYLVPRDVLPPFHNIVARTDGVSNEHPRSDRINLAPNCSLDTGVGGYYWAPCPRCAEAPPRKGGGVGGGGGWLRCSAAHMLYLEREEQTHDTSLYAGWMSTHQSRR